MLKLRMISNPIYNKFCYNITTSIIDNSLIIYVENLSLTIQSEIGDVFGWNTGKIHGNDAQLFVYLINNNGIDALGISPCPALSCVASDYYDGNQMGQTGHTNIIMSMIRNPINSCQVVGRINVRQEENNYWKNPTIAKIINRPIYKTDFLDWTPTPSASFPMTFNDVTIHRAKYRVINDVCKFHLDMIGTTGGIPSLTINSTNPILPRYKESPLLITFSSIVYDVSFLTGLGYILPDTSPSLINFGKGDLISGFGLGHLRRVVGMGEYQIS